MDLYSCYKSVLKGFRSMHSARSQALDARCAHSYWGDIASGPFQWTKLENISKNFLSHGYITISSVEISRKRICL